MQCKDTVNMQLFMSVYTIMVRCIRTYIYSAYSSVVEVGSCVKTVATLQLSISPVSGCTCTWIGEACTLFFITHTWCFFFSCFTPNVDSLSFSFSFPLTSSAASCPLHLLRLAWSVYTGFTLTLVAGLRFRVRASLLLEAKKRLGRLLERKKPRSICPVIWLVVCNLSGELCFKSVLNFSAVGKDVVLELFLRVCPLHLSSWCLQLSASLSSWGSGVLCLCLACHLQWSPRTVNTMTTNMAAVMKMVMDETRRAMLRETLEEVLPFSSVGSENWNDSVSGRIEDLVGVVVSDDVCWILYFISSWNGPVRPDWMEGRMEDVMIERETMCKACLTHHCKLHNIGGVIITSCSGSALNVKVKELAVSLTDCNSNPAVTILLSWC